MLLSHTPTGAAAPDLIFCARLPAGQQHLRATRCGELRPCPRPCALVCPLQQGACVSPPEQPSRLSVSLSLRTTLAQLLEQATVAPIGCVIGRN